MLSVPIQMYEIIKQVEKLCLKNEYKLEVINIYYLNCRFNLRKNNRKWKNMSVLGLIALFIGTLFMLKSNYTIEGSIGKTANVNIDTQVLKLRTIVGQNIERKQIIKKYFVDEAGVFSKEESEVINRKYKEISDKWECDIATIFVNHSNIDIYSNQQDIFEKYSLGYESVGEKAILMLYSVIDQSKGLFYAGETGELIGINMSAEIEEFLEGCMHTEEKEKNKYIKIAESLENIFNRLYVITGEKYKFNEIDMVNVEIEVGKQRAYDNYNSLLSKSAENEEWNDNSLPIDEFSMLDINGDGIEELIVGIKNTFVVERQEGVIEKTTEWYYIFELYGDELICKGGMFCYTPIYVVNNNSVGGFYSLGDYYVKTTYFLESNNEINELAVEAFRMDIDESGYGIYECNKNGIDASQEEVLPYVNYFNETGNGNHPQIGTYVDRYFELKMFNNTEENRKLVFE